MAKVTGDDETVERFCVQSLTGDVLWLVRKVRHQGTGKARKVVKEWFGAPEHPAVKAVEPQAAGIFIIRCRTPR